MRDQDAVNVSKLVDIERQMELLIAQQEQLKQNYERQHSVQLPPLEIPYYNGNRLQWNEFWDLYKVAIDDNLQLSDIDKFHYLKGKLTGEAKDVISGISVTNDNYRVAKTLLKQRYEDTQLLSHYHNMELINLTLVKNNTDGLRIMNDKIENHLRSLEALKQNISHDIYISIIVAKIPKDILVHLELQKGMKNKWTVNRLRELFNEYICAREKADQLSCSQTTKTLVEGNTLHLKGNIPWEHFIHCRYCKGNHWTDECKPFSTVEERKAVIKQSCFRCLRKGHKAYQCLDTNTCFHCGRRNHHHRSLCPHKFALVQQESDQELRDDMEQAITHSPVTSDKNEKINVTRHYSPGNQPKLYFAKALGQQQHSGETGSQNPKTQQILDQVKNGLSESTAEKSNLKEKIYKIEEEQVKIQQNIVHYTDSMQMQQGEINRLKELVETLRHEISNLSRDLNQQQALKPEVPNLCDSITGFTEETDQDRLGESDKLQLSMTTADLGPDFSNTEAKCHCLSDELKNNLIWLQFLQSQNSDRSNKVAKTQELKQQSSRLKLKNKCVALEWFFIGH